MFFRKSLSVILSALLLLTPEMSYAQSVFVSMLPEPGKMVGVSPSFTPVLVKGLVVHPDQPLKFDFIIDTGNQIGVETQNFASLQKESERMAKYFLAAVTVPEDQLWVNLSPYEKDRVIEDELGSTELGRDMLAQDYLLKQLTASLIYPEEGLGKDFWARVYREAQEKFGTTDIPVDTFNKVWIMPGEAEVFEKVGAGRDRPVPGDAVVYVTKSRLKVMLDSDYIAMGNNGVGADLVSAHMRAETSSAPTHELSKQLIREIILPAIEKEVNEGKSFAAIRQIYHAAILAKWYRELVQNTLLAQAYVGQNKVDGVTTDEKTLKEEIYQRYIAAYKQGVFDYIKEAPSPTGDATPKKYFSGGISDFAMKAMPLARTDNAADVKPAVGQTFKVDMAMDRSNDSAMLSLDSFAFALNLPDIHNLNDVIGFLRAHYVLTGAGFLIAAHRIWKRYSIGGNVQAVGLNGSAAAQQRLLRMDLRALPALIEMNKFLSRTLDASPQAKFGSDAWKGRTLRNKQMVAETIDQIKRGASRVLQIDGSLGSFTHGGVYKILKKQMFQQNWFARIMDLGRIVIKFPTEVGMADLTRVIKDGNIQDPVRDNDELERFKNLDLAIAKYPEFAAVRSRFGDDIAHALVVFRIQHERLKASGVVGVPDARFVVDLSDNGIPSVAIVQEKIHGIGLNEMVGLMSGEFFNEYASDRQAMRPQLQALISSDLAPYIDWNISNFVWEPRSKRLYYIDSKPSTIVGNQANKISLNSLREVFIDRAQVADATTDVLQSVPGGYDVQASPAQKLDWLAKNDTEVPAALIQVLKDRLPRIISRKQGHVANVVGFSYLFRNKQFETLYQLLAERERDKVSLKDYTARLAQYYAMYRSLDPKLQVRLAAVLVLHDIGAVEGAWDWTHYAHGQEVVRENLSALGFAPDEVEAMAKAIYYHGLAGNVGIDFFPREYPQHEDEQKFYTLISFFDLMANKDGKTNGAGVGDLDYLMAASQRFEAFKTDKERFLQYRFGKFFKPFPVSDAKMAQNSAAVMTELERLSGADLEKVKRVWQDRVRVNIFGLFMSIGDQDVNAFARFVYLVAKRIINDQGSGTADVYLEADVDFMGLPFAGDSPLLSQRTAYVSAMREALANGGRVPMEFVSRPDGKVDLVVGLSKMTGFVAAPILAYRDARFDAAMTNQVVQWVQSNPGLAIAGIVGATAAAIALMRKWRKGMIDEGEQLSEPVKQSGSWVLKAGYAIVPVSDGYSYTSEMILDNHGNRVSVEDAYEYVQEVSDPAMSSMIAALVHNDVPENALAAQGIDVLMIPGNDDINVFRKVLDFKARGIGKHILISGGTGRLTLDLKRVADQNGFDVQMASEAEMIRSILIQLARQNEAWKGLVPQLESDDVVILEKEARFTVENFSKAKVELKNRGLLAEGKTLKVLYIQKPLQQLRTKGNFESVFQQELKDGTVEGISFTTEYVPDNKAAFDVVGEFFRVIANGQKGDWMVKGQYGIVPDVLWDEALTLFNAMGADEKAELVKILRMNVVNMGMTDADVLRALPEKPALFAKAILDASMRVEPVAAIYKAQERLGRDAKGRDLKKLKEGEAAPAPAGMDRVEISDEARALMAADKERMNLQLTSAALAPRVVDPAMLPEIIIIASEEDAEGIADRLKLCRVYSLQVFNQELFHLSMEDHVLRYKKGSELERAVLLSFYLLIIEQSGDEDARGRVRDVVQGIALAHAREGDLRVIDDLKVAARQEGLSAVTRHFIIEALVGLIPVLERSKEVLQGFEVVLIDKALVRVRDAVSFDMDAAQNGGIDIKNINVDRKGGAKIQFNEQALRDVLDRGFTGFTPVILNVTPMKDPFTAMGLAK